MTPKNRLVILLLLDLVSVYLAFGIASLIRFGQWIGLLSFLVIAAIFLFFMWMHNLYNIFSYLNITAIFFRIIPATIISFLFYIFLLLLSKAKILESRPTIIFGFFLLLIIAAIMRTIIFPSISRMLPYTKIGVIADGAEAGNICNELRQKQYLGLFPMLEEEPSGAKPFILVEKKGGFSHLVERMENLLALRCPFLIGSPLLSRYEVDLFPQIGNIKFTPMSPGPAWYRTAKSVVGRIIALFLILILSPLFLILAVFIKITGGPSVIFTQERLREGCKPFRFYKFRTMFDSDENLENHKEYVKKLINGDIEDETYKPRNHPNVTQLGRFLRKTSLDELPQLFNILKGDMSIIGPRPPIPYEVEFYKRWHKRRLDGPQGLTGMWQVYGRSTLPFDESVFLDIYYLMNSSFGLDCYLFFRTIPVLIFGKGGY